ncbi:hypothetical protein GGTG_12767 [Gaeumannomyces tritici R3-111a-1]|uniref:Uncharacterized protein n=1 Tax=Gaeumannomyces tritici (strain R3-111a-1) TaxID=644352 RepID=J3PGY7_GAET3|nr:hypothetical protein GGTG_12767 [Gaeumannomyces tritici R3-111a-1]EJT69884.1 hypothetical protein GGTG_12767 [Gaeumannomyces tritici R3-111a-1]
MAEEEGNEKNRLWVQKMPAPSRSQVRAACPRHPGLDTDTIALQDAARARQRAGCERAVDRQATCPGSAPLSEVTASVPTLTTEQQKPRAIALGQTLQVRGYGLATAPSPAAKATWSSALVQ